MNTNEKPQDNRLGQINNLDDESINRNVIAINSQSTKSQYIFGKSCPLITDYDIAEHELFPDINFFKSMIATEKLLRASGLPPCWKPEDKVRFHRHQWMFKTWTDYRGARR